MQDKTIRTLGTWLRGATPHPEQIGTTLTAALALAAVGLLVACAGSDTPETDADFRAQIAAQRRLRGETPRMRGKRG